jgi:hypothetical protein
VSSPRSIASRPPARSRHFRRTGRSAARLTAQPDRRQPRRGYAGYCRNRGASRLPIACQSQCRCRCKGTTRRLGRPAQ